MEILIACEYSGVVRDSFAAKGHNVWSCDLLPTEKPGQHYQGDVRDILYEGWDLLIAHPECTYLCNSGVRWLHSDITRWPKLFDAAAFYKLLLDAPIEKKCIENPIFHKYARQLIGSNHTQIVQPWWFGHGETKATGLNLYNLPKLKPTEIVDGRAALVHRMPPSPERSKMRSKTCTGLGAAMAEQWT